MYSHTLLAVVEVVEVAVFVVDVGLEVKAVVLGFSAVLDTGGLAAGAV